MIRQHPTGLDLTARGSAAITPNSLGDIIVHGNIIVLGSLWRPAHPFPVRRSGQSEWPEAQNISTMNP